MERRRVRATLHGSVRPSTGPGEALHRIDELMEHADGRERSIGDLARRREDVSSEMRRYAINDYLDTCGLRAIRYEVAYPTVASGRSGCFASCWTTGSHSRGRRRTRVEAERRLLDSLGDTDETAPSLETARHTVPVRGATRRRRSDCRLAVIRHVGLAGGRRLSRAGNLERPDDFFDLTINEVTAVLLGSSPIVPPDPALRAHSRREAREPPRTAATAADGRTGVDPAAGPSPA